MLNLFEELFLLSLHEEKCSLISATSNSLRYGLGGAILTELTLLGKVSIGEKRRLELLDGNPTGDELFDSALEKIKDLGKAKKVGYWVSTLSADTKKLYARLIERLIEKEAFTRDEDDLNWIIPYKAYPELNASVKFALKSHMRWLVLTCGEPDLNELALLCQLQACNLLDLVFVKDERKLADRRIREMVISQALRNPAAQAIEEIGSVVASLVEEE